jgi:hypothetical protein
MAVTFPEIEKRLVQRTTRAWTSKRVRSAAKSSDLDWSACLLIIPLKMPGVSRETRKKRAATPCQTGFSLNDQQKPNKFM